MGGKIFWRLLPYIDTHFSHNSPMSSCLSGFRVDQYQSTRGQYQYQSTRGTLADEALYYSTIYILVQQSTTVFFAGLQVLRTFYKPMSMHKRTNSQNWAFCVLKKVVALKKKHFLTFPTFWSISPKNWIYGSSAKLISLYRVYLFNFTLILWHIDWKLWTSIKVSCRLGKHLNICFLI